MLEVDPGAVEAIRRLLALYCHSIDARDREAFVALFASDARLVHDRDTVYEGHAGIHQHLDEVYSRWPQDLLTKHLLGASNIAIHGETAEALCDVIVFQCRPKSAWTIRQTARYVDRFRIEAGEWRFADRRIEADTFRLLELP